ncbi:MAG: peptide/nickel transport system substrate-binding protein [Thermomicrobiales bacterium]|nr:peptide/nickel transport system substrate-binding protein [Thermomicrobiales bacterium]
MSSTGLDQLHSLDGLRSGRLDRRGFIKGAAALGLSASTIGSLVAGPQKAAAQAASGVLQLGRESEFTAMFLPFKASTGGQTQVFDLIFSRLLKVDADTNLVPDLAESFEISPDATVFTFKLRQGMTWHDGTPLTAKDVVFTYKLAMTKAAAARQYGKLSQIKGAAAFYEGTATDVEGLEMPDELTVRWTLEKPNVAFMIGTALSNSLVWILPEHLLKDADPATLDQHPAIVKPTVGSGPYKFVEYVPDQHVAFAANENFYLGAPKIGQVFLRLAEPATQLAQLESGELHMLSRMAPSEAERLEGNEFVDVVSTPGVGIFQTAINNERFTDKRVRQAFMYAIDRPALLEAVLRGQGELVHQTVIGPEWAVYDDLNTYPRDVEKAKALLQEAGWDASRTVEVTWPKGFQAIELAAPVFQQQLAEVGVKIALAPLESAAYLKKVVDEPDFDLAWFGGGSYRLDPDVSSTYYMCANFTPQGGNTTHYCNETLDQLLVEGRGTTDIAQRTEIYHQVAKTLNEDVPTIFWWSDNQIFGISKKLQGVKPGPNQYIWWNIHEWSLTS